MVDAVQVREKGSGITTAEEADLLKYSEEAIRHHLGDYARMLKHITHHMNSHHHGKWTVFVVKSSCGPWELQCFPVEDKHIEFHTHGYEFFAFKSNE